MPVLAESSAETSVPMKKISLSLPSVKPECAMVAVPSRLAAITVLLRSATRSAPPNMMTVTKGVVVDPFALLVSITPSVVVPTVPAMSLDPPVSMRM